MGGVVKGIGSAIGSVGKGVVNTMWGATDAATGVTDSLGLTNSNVNNGLTDPSTYLNLYPSALSKVYSGVSPYSVSYGTPSASTSSLLTAAGNGPWGIGSLVRDLIKKGIVPASAGSALASGANASYLNPATGQLTLDPTGRNLQTSGLNTLTANLGQTRNSLLGNQGAYIQAIVNPTLERLAQGRGQLAQTLGRTGVRGTYANQAMQQYDINAARAEADARAQATQDTMNSITSLDQLLFNATSGTGQQLTAQDLQALGLSADTAQNLRTIAANLATGSGTNAVSGQQITAGQQQAQGENTTSLIGSALLAYALA